MTLLSPKTPNPYLTARNIQAVSYLYGLETPNIAKVTVLELGCGQGENLFSFCQQYPQATGVGIDVHANQIITGQEQTKRLQIQNLELYCLDLEQVLNVDLPVFDYIIIRGIYSQTDLTTRYSLLQHCQKHLAEHGVILIEYAVYPGAKTLEAIYESTSFHAAIGAQNPESQVQSIRAMLGLMGEGSQFLKKQGESEWAKSIQALEALDDENLYLQALGGLFNPCYFLEFANNLTEINLCYVGDANPTSELPEKINENIQSWLTLINPQQNKLLAQQYLDSVTQRGYRWSMLTHSKHSKSISNYPNLNKLKDLHLAGYFMPQSINGVVQPAIFTDQQGNTFTITNTTQQDIATALNMAWPLSLSYKEIADYATPIHEIINADIKEKKNLKKELINFYLRFSEKIILGKTLSTYNNATCEGITPIRLPLSENTYVNYWNQHYQPDSAEQFIFNLDDKNIFENNKTLSNLLVKKGALIGSAQDWFELFLNELKYIIENFSALNEDNLYYVLSKLLNYAKKISKGFYHSNIKETKIRISSYLNKSEKETIEAIRRLKIPNKEKSTILTEIESEKRRTNEKANILILLVAIELNPKNFISYHHLAVALNSQNEHLALAYNISKNILNKNKNSFYILSLIANLEAKRKNTNVSIEIYKHVKKENPKYINNINSLALTYSEQGKTDLALKEFEPIIHELSSAEHSNYLFLSLHSDYYNEKKLYNIHRQYGERIEQWANKQNWNPSYDKKNHPTKKLRIGFVSGDFRDHAVTKFLLPYWEGLDTDKFEIFAYATSNIQDHITERLKIRAYKWTNIYNIDNLSAAKLINNDNINILIDLSGHTGYNRLPVFALKPAPVQMTWIGYPATTGLKEIDYRISSAAHAKLDWMQEQFTEKLLYMDVVPAFDNTVQLPAIAEQMPYERNGYFTFASFNRPQKISDEVLKTWAEIMQLCPNDKLLIANMSDDETTASFKEKLIDFGAMEEQLLFKKRVGINEYMEMHNEVDLLLDTFPYNGGTTTFHAISMGVATVALAGKSAVSHPSIFYIYELEDFLASNTENYKTKALLWRQNPEKLLILKRELREKFEETSLNKNAKNESITSFSNLLKYAWDNYLENGDAKSAIGNPPTKP